MIPNILSTRRMLAVVSAVALFVALGGAALGADSFEELATEAHELELAGRFRDAQNAFAGALVAASVEAQSATEHASRDPARKRRAAFLWAWCEVLAENAHQLTHWTARSASLVASFERARAVAEARLGGSVAGTAASDGITRARRELAAWLTWRLGGLRKRTGASDLARAEWAKLGFITDWQVIGPFENEKGGGFGVQYPPEKALDFDAEYPGKRRPVRWRSVPAVPPDGVVDLDAMLRPNEECIAYAACFVRPKIAGPVLVRVAADDGFELWLNGRKLASRDVERACYFDQDVVAAALVEGWNVFLIKVADAHIAWEFSLRLTSPDGRALMPGTDIEVSAVLPESVEPTDGAKRLLAGVEAVGSNTKTLPGSLSGTGEAGRKLPGGAVRYFQDRIERVFRCRDGALLEVAAGNAPGRSAGSGGTPRGLADALSGALGKEVTAEAAGERAALEGMLIEKTGAEWAKALPGLAWEVSREEIARWWYGLGRLHSARGAHGVKNHPDRQALLLAHRLAPADPVYLYALARVASDWVVMEAERNENPRMKLLTDLLATKPDAAVARYELASYYLQRQDNPARALSHAKAARKVTSCFPLAELTEIDCRSRRGWRELARAGLAELARKYPEDPVIQGRRAAELRSVGRASEALGGYRVAFGADAGVEHYAEGLTRCYEALGKTYAAIDLVKRRVAADPFDVKAHLDLARLYEVKENYTAARAACEAALAIAPEDHTVLEALGRVEQALGKPKEAAAAWHRALELAPNFVRLERYLEFLEDRPGYDRVFAEDTGPLLDRARDFVPEEDDPLVEVLDKTIDRVHPDGTMSRTVHRMVLVRNSRGIDEFGAQYVFFYPAEQVAKIRTARVHRADGSVEDAPTGESRELGTGYAGRSAYRLDLPPLRAGDVVEIEHRIDDTRQGFFGKYFGNVHAFQGARPKLRSKYVLIVPKDRRFHFHTRGGELAPVVTEWPEADAVVRTWTVEPAAKIRSEPLMPGLDELSLAVHVSTYGDWGEFGRWYWHLVKDQHRTNAEIEEKTRLLTANAATEIDKIRAIYDFVTGEIQYSAWEFGVHGFKPYRATKIFSQRYGDCKDKATLLKTMLAHVGVESWPAILRASMRRPAEDLTLPIFGHFNHMILYVPPKGERGALWLDGTTAFHGMDIAPVSNAGASACVAGPEGGRILRIPTEPPEKNSLAEEITFDVAREGDALSTMLRGNARARGWCASFARFRMSSRPVAERALEHLYSRQIPGLGMITVGTSDLADPAKPVTWEFTARAGEFGMARPAGSDKARWFFRPFRSPLRGVFGGEWALLAPESFSDYTTKAAREHDLVLAAPWRYENTVVYRLGDGLAFARVPRSVEIEEPFGRFRLKYRREGRELTVTRVVEISTARVTPEQYEGFRRFTGRVDRAERREIGIGEANERR